MTRLTLQRFGPKFSGVLCILGVLTIELVLLGLLGVAVFGTAFTGVGNSDAEDDTLPEPPGMAAADISPAELDDILGDPQMPAAPEVPQTPDAPPVLPEDTQPAMGATLVFDGADTLTGTEGNDTLAAGRDFDVAPLVVNLLGGADVATVDLPIGMAIFGGAGDDMLTSTEVGNALFGGEGDDTLSGIDATNMYGGAGDDVLTINLDVELNDTTAVIDGGAGDDSLTLHVRADNTLDSSSDRGGALLTGGAGADRFAIVMDLTPMEPVFGEALNGNGGAFGTARIMDFDPALDQLTIEIDATTQTEAFGLNRVGFEQIADDAGYLTQVQLYFANAAGAAAYQSTSTVMIRSAVPFTLADITFVNA
jgi:Ca2+-binding RTX toxin-like protein